MSLTNSYSSFSLAVAGLFSFNLICAQFTVPVDAITALLKKALQFHKNGTVATLLKNAQKTATFPPFYDSKNRHVSVTGTVCVCVVLCPCACTLRHKSKD